MNSFNSITPKCFFIPYVLIFLPIYFSILGIQDFTEKSKMLINKIIVSLNIILFIVFATILSNVFTSVSHSLEEIFHLFLY